MEFFQQLRERLALILAVAASTLWLFMLWAYVSVHGGWAGLKDLGPLDLAILVAAASAPLAALWLIFTMLEQRRAVVLFSRRLGEMAAQNRQGLQQAESQARTLMQLQAQGARAQAMETRRLALNDMASSAAVLAERLGVIKRDAAAAAWARYGDGDTSVFVQAFLSFANSHPDMAERMAEAVARDLVAAAALASFVRRYERLLSLSADDKLAVEIFDDGALGRGFRLFKAADALAAQLASPQDHEDAGDDDFERRRLAGLSERLEAAAP